MQKNIITPNQEALSHTLKNMKRDGIDKIHVLADFDKTLTKAFYNGELRPSLISSLRRNNILSEVYSQKAYALYDHYVKIEKDPNISLDVKKLEMTDWRNKHLQLLVESGLTQENILQALEGDTVELREGIKDFLVFLSQNNIPIVIISANGLGGDSIKLYLEKHGFLTPNVHIISNTFRWGENGQAVGYDSRVIHSFNKDETVLHEFPEIFEEVKDKTNVILLGDSLGDPAMIEGFEYQNLLKVGFLNEDISQLQESYKKLYDILFLGDSDATELVDLLQLK